MIFPLSVIQIYNLWAICILLHFPYIFIVQLIMYGMTSYEYALELKYRIHIWLYLAVCSQIYTIVKEVSVAVYIYIS